MPTYEYECLKCGHQFEVFHSIADKPLTVCPRNLCPKKKWGKGRVKKRISAGGGLLFKGSGFYTTDYRSDSYQQAAKKESTAGKSPAPDSKAATGGGGEASTKASPPKSESKAAKAAKPSS